MFTEVPGLRTHKIVQLKAKDVSAALTVQGHILTWSNPLQKIEVISNPSLIVSSFDLCQDFILFKA